MSRPIAILQQWLDAVPEEGLESAAESEGAVVVYRAIELGDRSMRLAELAGVDWAAAQRQQAEHLGEHDLQGKKIFVLPVAPIPLAMDLGVRLGGFADVTVFQPHHVTKKWPWPGDDQTIEILPVPEPSVPCHAAGPVIVRVSVSHVVEPDSSREVCPSRIGEFDISVKKPDEDALQSWADVVAVGKAFGRVLDLVHKLFPQCDRVHVFASVPLALAVQLGTQYNPTLHRPIQTYQYVAKATPRYMPALVLGDLAAAQLSDEDRALAATARGVFEVALAELKTFFSPLVGDAPPKAPLAQGFKPPRQVVDLGPLKTGKAILAASVDAEKTDVGGEFAFDQETGKWSFDDRLLSALAATLGGDELKLAARLFLLHEVIHVERQGITSSTAAGVGRFPRVLEEIDYSADVWAMFHEFERVASTSGMADPLGFLRSIVKVAIKTFWAFDAGALPLRNIQVRRLNRYLIWYWQLLRLNHASSVDQASAILSSKPVLEITGPRAYVENERVVLDLELKNSRPLELGVLLDGGLVRRGVTEALRLRHLLQTLRMGQEGQFLNHLRAVFEDVDGGTHLS